MKDKLMKALALSNNPRFKQLAQTARLHSVTITYTVDGFDREMVRRRKLNVVR